MTTAIAGASMATPGPNLIVNGSFENFAANTAKWSGWTGLTAMEGWTLAGEAKANTNWFEPHASGYNGVRAVDGRAMLDMGTSPGNISISQTVKGLEVGARYMLSYSMLDPTGDNRMVMTFDNVAVAQVAGGRGVWNGATFDIVAKNTSLTIGLREVGKLDNTGTYLDNVRLVKIGPSDAERAESARIAAEKAAAEQLAAEKAAAEKAAADKIAADKLAADKAAFEAEMAKEAARIEVEKAAAIAEVEKVMTGTDGADELWGAKATTEIHGGDGNDHIVSSAGGAKVDGGKGFNTLSYLDQGGEKGVFVDLAKGYAENTFGAVDSFANIQKVIGSYFADELFASETGSVLDGHDGDDALIGREGKDLLFGGAGNDKILGGAEAGESRVGQGDTLVGGHGDDTMDGGDDAYNVVDYSQDGGARAVSVDMGKGLAEDSWGTVDTLVNVGIVKGTDMADWMKGGAADIIFDGKGGDDVLTGGAGLNELYGAAGDDTLTGGDRTNYFEGGQGDDQINLGAGYNVVAMYGTDGSDVVNGFKATDTLRLYNGAQTAEELLKAASYHEHADGRDGLMFGFGDTKVFLAGVYELKAEQIQLVNI